MTIESAVSTEDVWASLGFSAKATGQYESIKIGENGVMVVPFLADTKQVFTHKYTSDGFDSIILCNREDDKDESIDNCVFCKTGHSQKSRLLMPAYDLMDRKFKILQVSDAGGPKSLRPQLKYHLSNNSIESYKSILITKPDQYTFKVTPGKKVTDDSQIISAIEAYRNDVKNGSFVPQSLLTCFSNEQMSEIPYIAERLINLGYE